MGNLDTRLKRLEKTGGADLFDLFIRAYHQIPPETHQGRGVLRFLTGGEGCTEEDTHAFLDWYNVNQEPINALLSHLSPGWEKTTEEEDNAAVSELANMLHAGGIGVDEVYSLFPDLGPKVMARRDVYMYHQGQGDNITVKLF